LKINYAPFEKIYALFEKIYALFFQNEALFWGKTRYLGFLDANNNTFARLSSLSMPQPRVISQTLPLDEGRLPWLPRCVAQVAALLPL